MEDFIADIYQYSFIISELKEFVCLLNNGRLSQARRLYNRIAESLENCLELVALSDPAFATYVQSIALTIKDCYEDQCKCKGLIEGTLIPALYTHIHSLASIEVSADNYTLKSSDTGFLTVKDNVTGKYLHDIHDPMHEAFQIINNLYSPEMDGFLILGCGLGYEAYQLYKQSYGSIKITIYEENDVLLQYATHYGVLSLIPDENIRVICNPDFEVLARKYVDSINLYPSFGHHICDYKKQMYNGVCNNEINRIVINDEYIRESSHISAINLRKNKSLERIQFSQIRASLKFDEYVIISAGPSLDDRIDFLRNNKGIKGFIAVNTVLRRLLDEGIVPDVIVAADPSPSLISHINGLESETKDIILIADWILSWKYATLFQGNICFVRTNASEKLTSDFIQNDPVWDINGTVACLGIEAAVQLGGKKIYLIGQDLAYPSGKKYAKGMPHAESPSAKWEIQTMSVDGSMVDTCEAFEWFKKSIEYQITRYNNTKFINMSEHGAYIKGALKYIYT